MKYITVGNNETMMPVLDVYAFIYDYGDGKTVIRCTLDASKYTLDDIKSIFTGDVIKIYEDSTEMLDSNSSEADIKDKSIKHYKLSYNNFCKDLKSTYNDTDGTWAIEVTQKTDTEILNEDNKSMMLDGYEAIAALYEAMNE